VYARTLALADGDYKTASDNVHRAETLAQDVSIQSKRKMTARRCYTNAHNV